MAIGFSECMRGNKLSDRAAVGEVREFAERMRENVQRVIVGRDDAIRLAVVAMLCRGHLLVEDAPGIGKTTLAKALAQSLRCTFRRIQFTPDLMPTDVLGVNFYNQRAGDFEFRQGPIFSQIVLADEINRATPRTQSALLEAMQERQATVDGETRQLPDPFMVLATQNPIEMEGTFPLPEAQLDRFMLRARLGYPTPEEESDILARFERESAPPEVAAVADAAELAHMQAEVLRVFVDDAVREYVVAIVQATRRNQSLTLGASPRAGLALYKGAQALAAIEGRDFVAPDDVKALAVPTLAHRLIVASNARLRGRTAEHILREILAGIAVPIERKA